MTIFEGRARSLTADLLTETKHEQVYDSRGNGRIENS